ncbi:LuxR C-terminal-related transcriptional regulator [Kluyvera intermedia]|uniref:LuxR C-terminal-related transcriptional regulator n=1 Tax=Kluyvera intermedia TaxID=61648 RepID=UPI0035250A25
MSLNVTDDGTLAAFGVRCLLDVISPQVIKESCTVFIASAEMPLSFSQQELLYNVMSDKRALIIMVELGCCECPQKIPRLINDRIFYVDGKLSLSAIRTKLQYLLEVIIYRNSDKYYSRCRKLYDMYAYHDIPQILSQTESQVLDFLFKGYSTSLISRVFGFNKRAVSMHKRSGMRKLGVNTLQSLHYLHCLRYVTNSAQHQELPMLPVKQYDAVQDKRRLYSLAK